MKDWPRKSFSTTSTVSVLRTRLPHRLALSVAVCCTMLLAGCAGGSYYASDLPAELQAPPLAKPADVDLAKFAKPTTTTDVVEPGDVMEIAIATGLEGRFTPKWSLRVDDAGVATVPIVGPVRLAGMSMADAHRAIYDAAVSRGYYRDPNVTLRRLDRRASRVVVAGAVRKPGSYDLPTSSCDVLSALVAAGGLSPDADTIVEIRQPTLPHQTADGQSGERLASFHPNGETPPVARAFQIDLTRAQHLNEEDVALSDGAVITVRERPKHVVAVMGKVKRPGQFEIPKDTELRFLDAIALAGGRTMQLADKAYVVRQAQDDAEPVLIRVSISDAKSDAEANLRLAPGDVVSVEETPFTVGVETLTRMIRLGFSSRLVF